MTERSSLLRTRSHASRSSRSSSGSAMAAAAVTARADAEARKARLAFADSTLKVQLEKCEFDASTSREKCKLDASISRLEEEKEAAAAEAKAGVLEAANNELHSRGREFDPTPLDNTQRTRDYLEDQALHHQTQGTEPQLPQHQAEDQTLHRSRASHPSQNNPIYPIDHHSPNPDATRAELPSIKLEHRSVCNSYDYNRSRQSAPQRDNKDLQTTDFLKYFARRELITTGLLRFNDQPESYRAWKRSFLNTTRGLDLSHSEEMDLLVKWLGEESVKHAARIRAVHLNYPENGLKMLWDRLEECYGSPELIEDALFKRVDSFPKLSNRDHTKLRELSDLLMELQSAKDEGDLPGLSFLDTARGTNPIAHKLPFSMQEKWLSLGSSYKQQHRVPFPPFAVFVDFVRRQARIRNDPSFSLLSHSDPLYRALGKPNQQRVISVHKTELSPTHSDNPNWQRRRTEDPECPIHGTPHPLRACRAFREKPLEEREAFIKQHRICFRCCTSTAHIANRCRFNRECAECGSEGHNTALHPGPAPWNRGMDPAREHGGEEDAVPAADVTSQCTQVCGGDLAGRSCAKICLAKVYPVGQRDRAVRVYAIVDEQSNRSLARSDFFDVFDDNGPSAAYSLKTCAGVTETVGRRASGYQIESTDGQVSFPLPSLIECNEIPNERSEIPTPNAALNFPHLKRVAHLIPELEPKTAIMLLLGRDVIRAHKVRRQVDGPDDAPYAQKLDLGWVIVGNVCMGSAHRTHSVNAFYTNALEGGRPTIFKPCPNVFQVRERYGNHQTPDRPIARCDKKEDSLGHTVFQQTKDDNKLAPSIEDALFLEIMKNELRKNETKSWVAPLPFKPSRRRLPDNRTQAASRLSSLRRNLQRKPEMKEHFLSFMENIFRNDHAEVAPPLKEGEERWYLPTFGVYHPKKPGKIRVVFDSSAQYGGVSLNDVLLTGPDLNNALLGVLIRFRKEPVAITADIEQMFHCFLVRKDHRNFLRFLWFQDNDPTKEVIEYRMKVHVFGNSPSPAVAIHCLRQSVREGQPNHDPEVKQFVDRDFYVDDGLKSLPTVEAAVSLLHRSQNILAESNLRLHKIASNKKEVMAAFPSQDHASDLKDLDLGRDVPPTQRSLGLNWDLGTDTFTFKVAEGEKPFTRRGVLSTVNSLYDPLGFVAPVTVQGKSILRELTLENKDWDSPLPREMEGLWVSWRDSLRPLDDFRIPRTYTRSSPSEAPHRELCIFGDASTEAIAAVAYLKVTNSSGNNQVGFVMGKTKLTPRPEHSIPRLELCAAVLAIELAELIASEIDMRIDATTYYTDSKVVLGYIHNETRRFYVYVNNRVVRIRRSSRPEQWRYVPTDQNPADCGTRSVLAAHLPSTTWLTGPAFLLTSTQLLPEKASFDLVRPTLDTEIRPQVSTLHTSSSNVRLGSQRFARFSTWASLNHAIATLIHVAQAFRKAPTAGTGDCRGWHRCHTARTVRELSRSKDTIIQAVQEESFGREFSCLRDHREIPKDSPLRSLDPFVDDHGLLRVGGRIREAELGHEERNPLIIPGKHHIAPLLVRYYHGQTQHQGRLFTEGAVRAAGLWIIGGKRCVSRAIHHCVTCRRLRRPTQTQKMADLPTDRLSTEPPFTNVGLDVFGPWPVSSRRTRGGLANSKRWAVMFTCMSTRAVHIEVIESLDTSSFINALRRLFSIRGPAKHIRSDRGTNFIGACKELDIPSNIDTTSVEKYLTEQECTWTFNPPHAPHMGGAWERMIGMAKKILNSMFLQQGHSRLTHEVLTTFMAEVAAIINARPLVPVSTDPDNPLILTPATLLTQKVSAPTAPAGEFGAQDIFRRQWRYVQHLAQTFWSRWRKQYLTSLQARRKWISDQPNLELGSVVLLKDSQAKRNEWPLGLITQVFPGRDGKVRKVEIKICKRDGTKTFLRPISEVVLLLPPET